MSDAMAPEAVGRPCCGWGFPRTKVAALVVCSLLIALFAGTAWRASLSKSATTDEPAHLISSLAITHLHDFRLDGENPPLWKYWAALGDGKVPLNVSMSSPEWRSLLSDTKFEGPIATHALYETPGLDADTALRGARLRMLVMGVLLGCLIAWWAWRIAGAGAGVLACLTFCLDPNFLGHAPLVKNDVVFALAVVALAATAWRVGQGLSVIRWLLMSLALGAAILTKFSGVLAIPILFLLLVSRSLLHEGWPVFGRVVNRRVSKVGVAIGAFASGLLVVWLLIWACYGFRFTPSNDPGARIDFPALVTMSARHDLISRDPSLRYLGDRTMNGLVEQWREPVYVRGLVWADGMKVLPEQFLGGLLDVYGWTRGRKAFLMGKKSLTGWWYYFPVTMAVKTPLAILVGCVAFLIWCFRSKKGGSAYSAWTMLALTVFPGMYLALAMASNVNVGLRHVLAVYPFIYISLGVFASRVWKSGEAVARLAIVILLAGLATETAFGYPDYISFFNLAVGGQRGGAALFRDTNIDWGQDLPALADWQKRHPDRQLYLLYWGSADPRYYGIHYVNLPQSMAPEDEARTSGLKPAYAISVSAMNEPETIRKVEERLGLVGKGEAELLHGSIYIFK